MSGSVWERVRAREVAAQRYLRTSASVLEWFAVAVHYTARESGLLLATCVALYAGRWSWALRALLAMSLGEMLNGLLKFATHEPRPVWREDVAQSPFAHARRTWEDDYSFPSSHAQVMLGLAVSFQHLVPDRPRLVAAAFALALAAGVTRAYLGQHYLHDVVAGWLVELAFVVPYWRAIDALVAAPVPVVVAVAASLFFFPLLLELVKFVVLSPPLITRHFCAHRACVAVFPSDGKNRTLKPLESDAQVRKWEDHARAKTGCKNKTLHPLNTGKYCLAFLPCTLLHPSPIFLTLI